MTTLQLKKYLASAALATMAFSSAGVAMADPINAPDMKEMHVKMQKIMDEHHRATEDTMKQLFVKEAELKGEMWSVKPDTTKIETLLKDIGALKGKLLVDRVKMNQDFEKEGLPPQRGMHMLGWGDDCGFHNDRGHHGDRDDRGHRGDRDNRGHRGDRDNHGYRDNVKHNN